MRNPVRNHVVSPDFVAALTDLPVAELRARGVTALAFDLDHTLAHGRTQRLEPGYAEYLASLRRQGFRLLLASNTRRTVTHIGADLEATVVPAGLLNRKPMRRYYERVVEAAGVPADQVAMVGDRIINDVLGAHRAGLVTIKVDPLGRGRSWVRRLYDHCSGHPESASAADRREPGAHDRPE